MRKPAPTRTKQRSCKPSKYADEATARRYARKAVEQHGWPPDFVSVYPCDHCRQWHIGHDAGRAQRAASRRRRG